MRRLALLLTILIGTLRLEAATRAVAITFDDLPDINAGFESVSEQEAITARLLAALRRSSVPAIGFVNEDKLADENEQPDPRRVALIERWLDGGFEIGNHTFSHQDLNEVGVDGFEVDVVRGETVIRPMVEKRGMKLRWFRHPYLDTGKALGDRDRVRSFLTDHGYRVAPVTIDNSEWIYELAYLKAHSFQRPLIRHSYIRYMRDRFEYAESRSRLVFGQEIPQVLLLHAGALNADAFDRLSEMMRGRGYHFVSLDDATAGPAYTSDDGWIGSGVSWLERWGVARGVPEMRFENDPKVPLWIQRIAGAKDE
jgi:peptidoglycan/xylan/chitin deacetylase (PgdA/CDA1 family)